MGLLHLGPGRGSVQIVLQYIETVKNLGYGENGRFDRGMEGLFWDPAEGFSVWILFAGASLITSAAISRLFTFELESDFRNLRLKIPFRCSRINFLDLLAKND
jgi:hypothetical protein